jgi:hypothetical protein
MNEQLVSFIHHIRFDVFPHVPEIEKVPLFRSLLRYPVNHPQMFQISQQLLQSNQFHKFISFIKQIKRNKALQPWNPKKDMDLLLSVYFAELDPGLSKSLLLALLNFQITDELRLHQYHIGLNLLFSASCVQDKQAAIAFLQAV